MTSSPGFTVHVDHNPYLPVGGRDVAEDEMALDTRSVKTVRVGMDAREAPRSVRNDGF